MKRNAVKELIAWKEKGERTPFLLIGAKGVGKTYLAIEFASAYYPQYLYVNFELNQSAKDFFTTHLSTRGASLSETIALYFQMEEYYLSDLAIILDEISFCPAVYESLKIPNDLSVIAISGALQESEEQTFINGIQVLSLFPLGFDEFLSALGNDWYIDIIQGHFQNLKPVPDIVHQELLALFEEYLVVGGMPAAINEYTISKSIHNISEIHTMLTNRIRSVVSSLCNEQDAGRAGQILTVMPEQLKKENKKFRFNLIRKGVTYSLYKNSISLLDKNGFVLRLNEKNKESSFKLYMPDVGMLYSAFLGMDSSETRKALLENYVMQTLVANNLKDIFFWESDAQAKVDFIIKNEGKETPVELRTSTTGKGKSVASYFASQAEKGGQTEGQYYRFGFENFYSTSVLKSIPYYAIFCIK